MENSTETELIFKFSEEAHLKNWKIVDDAVMGGKSSSEIKLDEQGNGLFAGQVSLKNNGGFSSVRHRFSKKNIEEYTHLIIELKGDKKEYQLRIRKNSDDQHVYKTHFKTSGYWEVIKIPFHEMSPTFRGQKLDMANFSGEHLEEIGFLIANKKEENFQLIIKKIELG
ncbi:CIA30 family protein [Psychroflexus halocasei]|uniref:Complex I intermediate-associated protein 30 (CIA30) n=1 Tax=Psychroflexus halocasei TaxID=908615 RepID=A0A1H3ZX87_9FLAO|nr:CIA30 family protein [Psychroflexus halocasei]SEA28051.1 Complex I intermediate-associated protein 30 (CIA30) [Psychroflexus halocasei]